MGLKYDASGKGKTRRLPSDPSRVWTRSDFDVEGGYRRGTFEVVVAEVRFLSFVLGRSSPLRWSGGESASGAMLTACGCSEAHKPSRVGSCQS